MESSPTLPAATSCAAGTAFLARPTLLRNLGFWLLAMLLGLGLLLLAFAAMLIISSGNHSDGLWNKSSYNLVSTTAGLATKYSLAALPLLLLLLPWALAAPSIKLRWLRIFTLQSLSLGSLAALGSKLSHGGAAAPLVGTVYFVAGLLAAVVVYWPWLRSLR